jgi:hypothetical protein
VKTNKIAVFISLSYLVHEYQDIPKSIMDKAIIFAGSDRRWVFPQNDEEARESRRQPTDYMDFPEEFKELILKKEAAGQVLWLKPDKNFNLISDRIREMVNPHTGEKFKALTLDDRWWLTRYKTDKGYYHAHGPTVVRNYSTGEHDYIPTMELIRQSNPEMVPVLRWTKEVLKDIQIPFQPPFTFDFVVHDMAPFFTVTAHHLSEHGEWTLRGSHEFLLDPSGFVSQHEAYYYLRHICRFRINGKNDTAALYTPMKELCYQIHFAYRDYLEMQKASKRKPRKVKVTAAP